MGVGYYDASGDKVNIALTKGSVMVMVYMKSLHR